MPEQDIVAELRHWLNQGVTPPLQVIERARDEIVALRYTGLDDADANEALRKARTEALEEAAQLCQARFKRPLDVEALNCARAIRALKAAP